MGRLSKDLHVVIGVLLLQQLHDLSDAATVEALAFNMAWHYALDTRSEADSYFCEKTLRNYRRLFIEQGLDEMLFRRLTDRLVQAFSVDTSRQRMDSTALRSAMRAQTRLGIVVETISKFARELERRHPGLCRLIDDDVIARYVVREGEGCFANTAPSVSKRRLGEAGQDLLALAVQFRNTAAAKLSSFTILEQVLRDQFEIVDVVPKARLQRDDDDAHGAPLAAIRASQDVPCDTVGNPSDPDASYNAVLNKLPKSVQPRAKQHLQDIWMAETRAVAEKAFDFFLEAYGPKYDKAVACLAKDRDVLLAFYDFPAEHWKHIRTTNPIESTFATVRLRTTKTKGCLSRMTALTMVFKLCHSASKKWRRLDGPHQIADIIQGVKFKDGEKLTERAA